jgi:hypothetical protein
VASGPRLIVQLPRGSAVHRQLTGEPPSPIAAGAVVVETGATDAEGNLVASDIGQVVLSVPSPEALPRQADEVRRVITHAGDGTEPLIVVVEAAEELREEELTPLLEAVGHTKRAVILRIVRNA